MNDSLTKRYEDGAALAYLKNIRSAMQEHFICLSIDSQGEIIASHTVFIGTVNSVISHPREIFAAAIADHAVEIIVAHNHPSGGIMPSKQDIKTTQQLASAGQILGIPLKDHLIVTKNGYFSFLSHGLLS